MVGRQEAPTLALADDHCRTRKKPRATHLALRSHEGSIVILRIWTAFAASHADAVAYGRHLDTLVFPRLTEIEGHVGAYLAQRLNGDGVAVLVLTIWQSMEAIRAFAGDDPDVAVVEPEARRLLARVDDHVMHYEVLLKSAE
jgi:heme-degrading monooxygenase HmoA